MFSTDEEVFLAAVVLACEEARLLECNTVGVFSIASLEDPLIVQTEDTQSCLRCQPEPFCHFHSNKDWAS